MTRSCGKIGGVPIRAHDIGCKTVRHVYRADMAGKLPEGWSCSASLARCYLGEVGRSSEYMWWRRTTYRLLTTAEVVLGGAVYGSEHGEGWGTVPPKTIYNGGDPSGLMKAKRVGSCEGRSAYLKLFIREPRRPGGSLGSWLSWSGPRTTCEPYA
jgi:hypothetical protein